MGNNFAFLGASLRSYALNIERNSLEMQKDITMHVLAEVAEATPVDTGRAISNWIVESGEAANYSIPEPHSPGVSGSTRDANVQKTISDGDRNIGAHRGGELHITNNLRYIQELNDGTSKQAPAHFVETAALSAVKRGSTRSILNSAPNGRIV